MDNYNYLTGHFPGHTNTSSFGQASIREIENSIPGFRFAGAEVGDLFGGDGLRLHTMIFFFAGFALLIYLVLGGFELMTSAGSPDKAASGKAKVTNALIGFVIIFTAYWLVQIIGTVLGLEGITQTFGG